MGDAVADLEAAHGAFSDLDARVDEHGASALRRVASAHRELVGLLDGYESSATGTGNFETYVEFQERVGELVDGLPEDLPARDAFEDAAEELEQRTLRSKHFQRAREALAPAADLVDLLDEWETARGRYVDARRAAVARRDELDDRIAELEELVRLGDVDIDAPVDRLRDPISAYDGAVRDAFETFVREAGAREVFDLLDAASAYPLVAFDPPPERLRAYVDGADAGTEPIPTLLQYADYSTSKLDHYVDSPGELKRHVATNRTYLERLDAEPLTVDWPPPPAVALRFRCREYEAVVHRFADETVVERLRAIRELTHDGEYDRIREAARARAELDADERERLRSGELDGELSAAREERERIEAALDDYPGPE